MMIHTAAPTARFHEKLVVWKTGGILRAVNLRGYETGNESVLRLIDRADRAHALSDFAPVMVHTGDRPINEPPGHTPSPGWLASRRCPTRRPRSGSCSSRRCES